MMVSFGEICATVALLGCFYLLLAIVVVVLRKPRANQQLHAHAEPVSILKPLHGSEPRLAECLTSFCTQTYAGPMQLIFGLQDPRDAALAVAKKIKTEFSALPIMISIDGTPHGTNAKVSNLINMENAAVHDIQIAADSDILVEHDHIENVVALLQRPGAGAVSVLYHGAPGAGMWSRLSANSINMHFLPNVLVGMALGLARPCFGSTIAIRRKTLDAIGGFQAFANQLADDYAIGEAVRNAGLTVEIGMFRAVHICDEESARDLFSHQLRWARTIRTIDLPGYLGSFIVHPFAIASLGIMTGNKSCAVIAAIALCLRVALCKAVERSFQLDVHDYWLLPVTDLVAFSVYLWSFLGTGVTWKGTQYSVLSDGRLAHGRRG